VLVGDELGVVRVFFRKRRTQQLAANVLNSVLDD
jgi:hypothetical protein